MSYIISEKMQQTINSLTETISGGFATIHEYESKSGWESFPKNNINFISRFSLKNHYQKLINKISIIDFFNIDNEKINKLEESKKVLLFQKAKDELLNSFKKTLSGDRSDNNRKSHDLFYQNVAKGVRIHFKTERKDTVLVLDNGKKIADSVMVAGLEVSRKNIIKGKRKIVNSQAKTIYKNAILKIAGGNNYRQFSLKEDNFSKLTISKKELN